MPGEDLLISWAISQLIFISGINICWPLFLINRSRLDIELLRIKPNFLFIVPIAIVINE
jgi:hypothetical protein